MNIPTREDYLRTICTDALKAIDDYAHQRITIVDAVRCLKSVCTELGIQLDNPFVIFAAVESESDHLPSSVQRHLWDKQALLKADKEIEELNRYYRSTIAGATSALSEYIGNCGYVR